MPNWCDNYLTVSGEPEEIKKFVDANMGLPAQYPPVVLDDGTCVSEEQIATEKYFCFNAMIPTPQEVLDIGFDGQGKIPKSEYDKFRRGKTPQMLDGYHWNIMNWGTKWDIYYDEISYEELKWYDGCGYIEICFDTAWSPPIPWIEKNITEFPKLVFKLHYEEPGCYFAGDVCGEDGIVSHDEYDIGRCNEIFQCYDEDEE